MSKEEQQNLFNNDAQKKRRRPRNRDDVYEAVVKMFFPSGVSKVKSEKSKLNMLTEMARARLPKDVHKNAAIAMLRARVEAYKQHKKFGEMVCTPKAVLDHWDDLGESPAKALRELCKAWLWDAVAKSRHMPSDSDEQLYVFLNVMAATKGFRDRPDLVREARKQWMRLHKQFGSIESGEDLRLERIRAAVKECGG